MKIRALFLCPDLFRMENDMAHLHITGIDEFSASISKAEKMPAKVMMDILRAMGAALVSEIRKKAVKYGVPIGPMVNSASPNPPRLSGEGGRINVTFKGSRFRYNTETKETEIAFITNYGKKSEAPRPFISRSTEDNDSTDNVVAAGQAVFDQWIGSL